MSRRYSDRIRVAVTDPGDPAEPAEPRSFDWRRRRYRVIAVLARWIEAERWWRSAGFGGAEAVADSTVWRVEASSRGSPSGVFDLRCRSLGGRTEWHLIRAHD